MLTCTTIKTTDGFFTGMIVCRDGGRICWRRSTRIRRFTRTDALQDARDEAAELRLLSKRADQSPS